MDSALCKTDGFPESRAFARDRLERLYRLAADRAERETIVSSDREKLKCLKVLGEIEQYVHQNKRNPAIVSSVLQLIIDIGDEGFLDNELSKKRYIVENLKVKTASGQIKWMLSYRLGGNLFGEVLECLTYAPESELQFCELSKKLYDRSWDNIRMVVYDRGDHLQIGLSDDDKKFFFAVFNATKNRQKSELMDVFIE